MLKVLEGFVIDEIKTSVSYDKVVFKKGQILDMLLDMVYVRKGFMIDKVAGVVEIYYDPILEIPYLKVIRDDNDKQVYLGKMEIINGVVTMTYPNSGSTGGGVITSTAGVSHTETVTIIDGKIVLRYRPNVIMEIYVEGYGFMDVDNSITVNLTIVDLGTPDFNGYDVRIVYES